MTQRDMVLFLAGVEAHHALSHMLLPSLGLLPMRFTLTKRLNTLAIIANAATAAGLMYWAARLPYEKPSASPEITKPREELASRLP